MQGCSRSRKVLKEWHLHTCLLTIAVKKLACEGQTVSVIYQQTAQVESLTATAEYLTFMEIM